MPERQPTETVDIDSYGAGALPWTVAHDLLTQMMTPGSEVGKGTPALATVNADGTPHVSQIGSLWHEGAFYFTSGPRSRKSRNLAQNPAAALSMSLTGLDLAIEGTVERVTDSATLAAVTALYHERGWPATVEGDAVTAPYSAQSAGPPPWYLYRLAYHTIIGVATSEPYGASTWRFTV